MAYMDYKDITVHCPRKDVKFNLSLSQMILHVGHIGINLLGAHAACWTKAWSHLQAYGQDCRVLITSSVTTKI